MNSPHLTQKVALVVALGLSLWLSPGRLDAGDESKSPGDAVTVNYDHGATNSNRAYFRKVKHGETILVKVTNTCAPEFEIGVEAQLAEPRLQSAPCAKTTIDADPIVHDEKYGAYIVRLKNTTGAPITLPGANKPLNDVTLTISVETRRWDYEIAGGFTVSQLTDPRYGLETRAVDEKGAKVAGTYVVPDRDAEDAARLGAAALIHLFPRGFEHVALTFGIGVDQGSTTSYFAGPTWRFGDSGAITVGYNWGSVDRLPAGTDLSKPVEANFLSSLGKRVDEAWFLSFSYKFLGNRSLLEKPFKEATAAKKAEPAGAGSASPSSLEVKFARDGADLTANTTVASGATIIVTAKYTAEPVELPIKIILPEGLTLDSANDNGEWTPCGANDGCAWMISAQKTLAVNTSYPVKLKLTGSAGPHILRVTDASGRKVDLAFSFGS